MVAVSGVGVFVLHHTLEDHLVATVYISNLLCSSSICSSFYAHYCKKPFMVFHIRGRVVSGLCIDGKLDECYGCVVTPGTSSGESLSGMLLCRLLPIWRPNMEGGPHEQGGNHIFFFLGGRRYCTLLLEIAFER